MVTAGRGADPPAQCRGEAEADGQMASLVFELADVHVSSHKTAWTSAAAAAVRSEKSTKKRKQIDLQETSGIMTTGCRRQPQVIHGSWNGNCWSPDSLAFELKRIQISTLREVIPLKSFS